MYVMHCYTKNPRPPRGFGVVYDRPKLSWGPERKLEMGSISISVGHCAGLISSSSSSSSFLLFPENYFPGNARKPHFQQ